MSRLSEIPIRIEVGADGLAGSPAPAFSGGLGGGVAAILMELAGLLDQLAATQVPAAIDLRSLPMSPENRLELEQVLGVGEVRATVDAAGVSTVRETGISGIWWLEHRDARGELIAEFLEVAQVPQILGNATDEIAAAAHALRKQISEGEKPMPGRN